MDQKLILETIDTLVQFIPKVIEKTLQTVEYFQIGQESAGLKEIVELFDGYDWVTQAITGLQVVGVSINFNITDLQSIFKEMEQVLNIQDFVLLSDLLEYELCPVLETCHKELISIQKKQKEMGNS
jgi:hypothetical protein